MPKEVKVYKKADFEKAGFVGLSGSVIQTSKKFPKDFFIVRGSDDAYEVTSVEKKDMDKLFMNLRSGDNIKLSSKDLTYFNKGMKVAPGASLLVQKPNAQIHFRKNDEFYEGQLVIKNNKRKKIIIAAVIGGVVVVALITAAACIIFTPMGVVAILASKGLFLFNLAKAHPFMALSALSSVPMIGYQIYKYKTTKKDGKADKSDKVEQKDAKAKPDSSDTAAANVSPQPAG